MIDLSSLPEGTRFFEKDGLPVIRRPGGSYVSAVTSVVLRSPEDLMPCTRAEFDEFVAQWERRTAYLAKPPPAS